MPISNSIVRNPDLEVLAGNKARWAHADHRRWGFHNLHRIARYTQSFRAAEVMQLEKKADLGIAELKAVQHFTSLPWFSAMIVIRGSHILFERYAADFGANSPHSIQSITKTMVNLIYGSLVSEGSVDLTQPVGHYLPEAGEAYAHATVQQVLNMDVANDYSEDFTDPNATYYRHEIAMGWRLPPNGTSEPTEYTFIPLLTANSPTAPASAVQYKDANTAVLAWLAERLSERPLRSFLADIVDAAGLECSLHITTDRDGVACIEGGGCLTARDLARYFSIFVRGGRGIRGQQVGSEEFIRQTLASGLPMNGPFSGIRYSNHLMVSSQVLGHGGWGGQYALANLETGAIAVFFSVLENEHATTKEYIGPVIEMLNDVTGRST